MHFDIVHSAGKARAQAVQNRRQLVLERPLRRRLRAVLDRTYALAAEHAVHGVFDIEHVVDGQRGILQKAVSEHYTRVGQQFLASVEASIARRNGHPSAGRKIASPITDKSINRPVINNKASAGGQGPAETKGMAEEFWRAFHNWAYTDAFAEVKQINAATKTMLRRLVRREADAGSSYKVIADAITAKAKDINKPRAQRIARTEVHKASTFAVDAAVKSTRQKFEREWVSMNDDRVRPAFNAKPTKAEPWDHRRAHGQRRAMDEAFDVSGEKLMYPGDTSHGASAGNVINCRCVLLYHAVQSTVRWE